MADFVSGENDPLTTSANSGAAFTGGSGGDYFDGSLNSSGHQTLNSADSLNGGAGSDRLYAEIETSVTPAGLVSIETVEFTASNAAAATFNLTNAASVTTVSSQGSTGAAAITISGIGQAVRVNVSDTTQDHTITYNSVTGTSDASTVGVAGITGGTLSVAGIETLTLATSGSASTIATLTSANTNRLVVTGDQNLTVTADLGGTVTTVDASAKTAGGVTVDLAAGTVTVSGGAGNDTFTFEAAGDTSVSGGAGNDTFDMFTATDNFSSADTINGGDGVDTLAVGSNVVESAAITTALTNVTSVETLNLQGMGADPVINVADISSSLNRVNLSAVTAGDGATLNFAAGSSTVGLNIAAAISAGDTLNIDAAGSGTSDSLTITNMRTATDNIGSATSSLTITDFETVSINTGTYATAVNQNLQILNAGTSAAITVTGGNSLALAGALTASSINASGMTGTAALIMGAAASSIATIVGSGGADTLLGDSSSNIDGGAGNDAITGGSGADTILGGAGNDTVTGAAGNDNVNLGDGDDRMTLASGALTLADTIAGGNGTDTLVFDALVAADNDAEVMANISGIEVLEVNIAGAAGNMTVALSNLTGSTVTRVDVDQLNGQQLTIDNAGSTFSEIRVLDGAAADSIVMDRLADTSSNSLTVSVREAQTGALTLLDVRDEETIYISGSNAANDITITTLTANDLKDLYVTGAADIIVTNQIGSAAALRTVDASASTGAVTLNGAASAVSITATAGTGVFTFTGGAAGDTITGAGADDVLSGNGGADSINGGAGADTITGGAGNDTLTGGSGADDFVFTGATGVDTITDFVGGTDDLDVTTGQLAAIAGSTATTAAGAGDSITLVDNDVQFVSLNGTAANLTTAGTATLAIEDMTASTLTNVATYLDERFVTSAIDGDDAIFVINWTVSGVNKSYVYEFVEANTSATIQAAELTLLGVVDRTSTVLTTGDVI